jgi:hypothetical protein
VARDWAVGSTIELIFNKMAVIAPDNVALIPFAIGFEDGKWHVDLMVKRAGNIEYDIHAEHADLKAALRGMYIRLGNWKVLERQDLS